MIAIDAESGQITLSEGHVLVPAMTRGELMKIPGIRSGGPMGNEESFSLPSQFAVGERWDFDLHTEGGMLSSIGMSCAFNALMTTHLKHVHFLKLNLGREPDSSTPAQDWCGDGELSPVKEFPAWSFNWGSAFAGHNNRWGYCQIAIVYAIPARKSLFSRLFGG
ncbi:MAG: hypothetical protein ABL949_15835 [Fimbriimonadaceae bacterium]